MTTPWIQHVKNYAQQNGVSYKEAMTLARPSYNKTGGSLKSVIKKVNKGRKKASKTFNDYGHLVEAYDKDLYNNLSKANEINDMVGGKFKLKRFGRKVKNTGRKVKNTSKKISRGIDKIAPMVAMVNPEAGALLEGVNVGIKGANAMTGGALGSKNNKYLGGSFSVPKRGAGIAACPHCHKVGGRIALNNSNSSLINHMHPSFKPKKINL